MEEKDFKTLEECIAVLDWVNANFKTKFHLAQQMATFQKMCIEENGEPIFTAPLNDCDNVIGGIFIMANTLKKQKGGEEE